jgi:nitroreductase
MTDTISRPAEYEFIRELRQTRTFTDQAVPESIVQDLLQIARWSGSSKNTQPWEFLVVRDPERIATISEFGAFSKFLKGAPLVIVLVFNGESPRSESYDEGRVSERLMLAAKAYGLGSGTGWWGTEEGSTQVKQVLGIPTGKSVVSSVAIGYPAPRDSRPGVALGRKPLAEIVHYETYGNREA